LLQWPPEQAEDLNRANLAVLIDASVRVPAGEIRVRLVTNGSGCSGSWIPSLYFWAVEKLDGGCYNPATVRTKMQQSVPRVSQIGR